MKPQYTKDGYEIANTTPGRVMTDEKRYINPKMENELKIFKKKILYRYANKEISDGYTFPRVSENSTLTNTAHSIYHLNTKQSADEDEYHS